MKYAFTLIFTFVFGALFSQTNKVNFQKATLQETMAEVDKLYQGRQEIEGYPKYKHFARWAYWWSSRVNADGSFPNVDYENKKAILEWDKVNKENSRSTSANWSFKGPEISTYANSSNFCIGNGYGRVDRISFHPTDPDKLYACSPSGGAWYSGDAGVSWSSLSDNLPVIGCAGIVVDADDPDILYILSGTSDNTLNSFVTLMGYRFFSPSIYRSMDHGANWEVLYDMTALGQNVVPYRFKMHPLDSEVMLAATNQGLLRSEDKGDSWQMVLPQNVTDIEFHPTDAQRVYASGFFGFAYSEDKGLTWNFPQGYNACPNGRAEIAVSEDDDDSVWLVSGPYLAGNSFCGLYKSTDSGENFQMITNAVSIIQTPATSADQTGYDLAIAISPNDSQLGFIAAQTIFSNSNIDGNILNWNEITPFWEAAGAQKGTLPSNYVHPDIHDLAYNPLDDKLYTANDGGVYVSNDNGANWTNITKGIHTAQIYNMNLSPSSNTHIGIGLQDNGIKIKNAANTLDILHVSSGDGYDVIFDPNNTNRVITSINAGLRYWPNFNNNVHTNANVGGNAQFFKPLRFKPTVSTQFYAGGSTLQIHTINPNNNTVNYVNSNTVNASASWELETCEEEINRVYSAGGSFSYRNDPNGSFYTSLNQGVDFNDKSNTNGFPDNLSKITDIATYPGDCDKVAFSCGGYVAGEKIFYSADKGDDEWVNITYNLPNLPVHAIEIGSDGRIYAGTENGVFFKEELAEEWLPFTNNLPRVPITDLEISNDNETIIASTFGRGVWSTSLPSVCNAVYGIFTNLEGDNFFEVTDVIVSSSYIKGGIGTEVHFHAGQKIVLEQGFRTSKFSKFYGKIAECGVGID